MIESTIRTTGNVEQFEAIQRDLDIENAKFIETLPSFDKLKFKAVEDALNILTKAEVPTIMFNMLPNKRSIDMGGDQHLRRQTFVQYNNTSSFMKEDPQTGRMDEKSYIFASYIWHTMAMAMVTYFAQLVPKDYTTQDMFNFIYKLLHGGYSWLFHGERPKEVLEKYGDGNE